VAQYPPGDGTAGRSIRAVAGCSIADMKQT
jgi:hypothetical protein